VSSSATTYGSSSKEETKTLDDLTKDRFNRQQQNIREQQIGRYSSQESTKTPPITSTIGSGFDYSYTPSLIPSTKKDLAAAKAESMEKSDAKTSDTDLIFGDDKVRKKPELERKLSDADIIFGEPDLPAKTYGTAGYSRYGSYSKANSAFSTSMSSESDYIYGNKPKDNSFAKSLSVSSDRDGDFSNDPIVTGSRNYQGITNDAFSDFDSPKSISSIKKWTDDDDYDLK
jgi:hypothetical protein